MITQEQAIKLIWDKYNINVGPMYKTNFLKLYPNTSGPLGGVGGQMMSNFMISAWVSCEADCFAVVFYGDKILAVVDDFMLQVNYSGYNIR